jgi:hypothetical protein
MNTKGNWSGSYGADGYNIVGGPASYPAYATVTPSGNSTYVWAGSTADIRAPQLPASTSRVAACWYTANGNVGSNYSVDVNLTDGNAHTVALYMLDWDNYGPRAQLVQVVDSNTGTVLDSRSVTAFTTGEYLVWKVSGHVTITVSNENNGYNGVASGLFFSPAQ